MVVYLLFLRYISCPYFWHVSRMDVLAIDFRRGRDFRHSVSGVLYIPFIYSGHNAKDRSLGVGRDINIRSPYHLTDRLTSKSQGNVVSCATNIIALETLDLSIH